MDELAMRCRWVCRRLELGVTVWLRAACLVGVGAAGLAQS